MVPVFDGRALKQQDDWYGGIYFRRTGPVEKGFVFGGHTHEIDHVTYVTSGSVKVKLPDGEAIYHAPFIFNVPAKREHSIEALEDGTAWACLFAITEDGRKINY